LLQNKKSNYGRLEFIVLEFIGREFEFIIIFPFLIILLFIEPEFIEPEFIEPEFIEPEFIEPEFIEPEFIEPEFIEPEFIEPEFIEPEFIIIVFEFIILEFILLALVLVLAASPQAIPNALIANTAERAKVFFILFKFSCLLQRLFYYFNIPTVLRQSFC